MLACLSTSSLLIGCCIGLQEPFFTHEARSHGLSTASSGSVYSCFALVQMLAFPAAGWLAPRLGVTRLYRLGLLLAGGSTVVFGLLTYLDRPAPFLAWCLTVRAAEAIGTAAAQTAERTITIHQFPSRMNSAISVVQGMYGGGMCLGPALGGALYTLGGYGLPFYTLGVLLAYTAAVSLALMPPSADRPADKTEGGCRRQTYRAMMVPVISSADNWLILITLVLIGANWNAPDANLEPYVNQVLGIQPPELSLFFLGSFAGYALSSALWGRLSDYIDNTFLLVSGCLAPTALGVLLVAPPAPLGVRPSRLLLAAGLVLRDVFQVGAYLPLLPLMVQLSAARGLQSDVAGQALVSAVSGTAYSLGNMLGPVGGGLVTDHLGFPVVTSWLAGATAVLCLLMAVRGLAFQVKKQPAQQMVAEYNGLK
ncbi:MFS-type transporter SLC18B1 [Amphibalanus amphitrite]|uniref:MFS-type transporter SLC18B1 n=1 Tax=Amphibalanus amphitrite TaxID=1232801 RepID=A0A6A4WI57_AMPAM|nr:MFS-type transporter SLC18B1 [Amphibalanus amphitrite]